MKLNDLLLMTPRLRRPEDYEAMYDDFIESSGGSRVIDRFTIPSGKQNADYWLEFGDAEMLVELKQVSKYDASLTVDSYFTELIRRGKVKNIERTFTGPVQISPDSLSPMAWRKFYEKFRPAIENALKKAAGQLRDTAEFVSGTRRKICGVILSNTGDYGLSTDLLFRLAEHKLKSEWKNGRFKKIEFLICHTVDLFTEEVHPLHSRRIVKSMEDEALVSGVLHLQEMWLSYVGVAMGFETKLASSTSVEHARLNLQQQFAGKIQLSQK